MCTRACVYGCLCVRALVCTGVYIVSSIRCTQYTTVVGPTDESRPSLDHVLSPPVNQTLVGTTCIDDQRSRVAVGRRNHVFRKYIFRVYKYLLVFKFLATPILA